ncbi:PAS domain S-box protein [Candidatus Methanoperedens nitratireducens]|uniref:histidine kinase n=1 Tax=Candidatus Methanoperedens nitratireducens TaxID=1392998 RepID=A0A284VKU9_9EURY
MKIKTQFINSMVIFGIMLIIIAASVIFTNQQVERLNTQEEIAKNIERGASELGYLSNDYLLYHESPQRARWESKFSELSNYLSNLNPNSPEQQTLVNNIRSNQQRLKAVFTDVVSTFENTSQGTVADPELFQVSWSRIAVQNQGMAFDAGRLSQMLHDQAEQLKQMNITLIFALLVVLGLYILTNYFIVYCRALGSISELQDGTKIIGSGNFDFAIKQRNDDEIGELSRSFNQMTANLKEVTASKTELEREITERKRAEEALRESEQRWATTLSSIGDAVISTDVEGRITFMNAVAEALTGWTLTDASAKQVTEVFNIINEYTRREADNPVSRVLREGTIVGLANHTILVKKDGTEVPIDDSGAPIRDLDGKTMGVVLVFRDITGRKMAEEALKGSEERLHFALETSHIGAWDMDLVDHTAHRSLEHDHIFGYEQLLPQWTYEMFLDHVLPEDRAMVDAKFIEATAAHSDWSFECRIRRVDGEIRWIWVAGRHQEDATGSARWMAGIVQDITERRRVEEALRKVHDELELRVQERTAELAQANEGVKAERQRLNDILNLLPAYLVLLSPDYHVSFANRFFRERFGESHGSRCYEYLFKRCEPCEICETYTVLKTKAPHHWEWTGPDCRNYDIFDFPFTDTDGSNLIMEVGIDITERKQAEEKIREQAALLDKAQDAIGVRDLEHRLIYLNKGAQRLYGWTAEEAIGKNADRLLYKEQSPQLIEAKKSVIEEGEWIGKLHQVTKDGKEIIVESRWTLVRDSEGRPKSILIINTDITGKEKLEAHLLRAQRMESIGTLAGGIAHDLNNMLTPIMISLQMLKEKFKDEQSQKLLTILENNSCRGADLIKQVLSFARGVEGERNPLQARHIITEIEKVARETFPRNIEIRTDIQKDLFTISGDATQLHQVIMNLCVNARDAMPDGGILSISAENCFIDENYAQMQTEAKTGSYTTIAVSDTGTGIPPKILDRIFEPFFTTKEFGKGTGLGLSTALAIVKSHGGFINVNSEVGKGTTFCVYLPAIKTEMQNIEEQQLELPTGHGELVLVTEDEDSVREVTISTLEKYGYNVLAANDGAQAVAEYAQNTDKIKVILMDMMMPVMDGHASIRAIRRINPEVKIIAVSGLAEKEKLKNIADYTNAFLPKPYTAEKLLKTIHGVLSAN